MGLKDFLIVFALNCLNIRLRTILLIKSNINWTFLWAFNNLSILATAIYPLPFLLLAQSLNHYTNPHDCIFNSVEDRKNSNGIMASVRWGKSQLLIFSWAETNAGAFSFCLFSYIANSKKLEAVEYVFSICLNIYSKLQTNAHFKGKWDVLECRICLFLFLFLTRS